MYRIKKKRKWSVFGFIIAFLLLAMTGLGIGYGMAKLSERTPQAEQIRNVPTPLPASTVIPEKSEAVLKPIADEPKETQAPQEQFMYLVKLEDGKTKVFSLSGNEKNFSHSLPVEPGSLREEDLIMLKKGIYLKTKNELLSFTEDFCS